MASKTIRLRPETYKRLQELAVIYNMQFSPPDRVIARAVDDLNTPVHKFLGMIR